MLDHENKLHRDHMSISTNFTVDDSSQDLSVVGNPSGNPGGDTPADSLDNRSVSVSVSGSEATSFPATSPLRTSPSQPRGAHSTTGSRSCTDIDIDASLV
jgi:hypothetical protein